ncbi:hypothetical protein C2125_13650 [Rahnella aquatilis]|nr:hypothetical protein C2125_13650 [Rahnella aquatilis]
MFLNLNSDPFQSDTTAVVTTFTFKATRFRAKGPGRGGFSGGRRGYVVARYWVLMSVEIL